MASWAICDRHLLGGNTVGNKEVLSVNMSSPFTAGEMPIIFQQYGTLVVLVDK